MAYTPVSQRIAPSKGVGYVPVSERQQDLSKYRKDFSEVPDTQFPLSSLGTQPSQAPQSNPLFVTGGVSTPSQTTSKLQEILSVPDIVSGAITQAPARGVALAAGLPQPKAQTFSEQALDATGGLPAPKPVQTGVGLLAGVIGDPLNLVGGSGTKGLKGLSKLLAKASKADEVATLLLKAGFADDIAQQYAPVFAKITDEKKIQDGLLLAEKLQNSTKAKVISYAGPTTDTTKTVGGGYAGPYPLETKPSAQKADTSGPFEGQKLYHDTTATGLAGILKTGAIDTAYVPFGGAKSVSFTRDANNFSRPKSPFRIVVDEKKVSHSAEHTSNIEAESVFRKPVALDEIDHIKIDVSNPYILDSIKSGELSDIIKTAKAKGIRVETFEGKRFGGGEAEALTAKEATAYIEKISSPSIPKELEGLKWRSTQDKGGIPGEAPLAILGDPKNPFARIIDVEGEDGVALIKQDGSPLFNPKTKNALFPNIEEAQQALTDFFNRVKGETTAKQLPTPEGLPKIPKAPTPAKLLGEVPPQRITRAAKEQTLLKEKIRQQAIGGRAGVREGEFLGRQTGFREGMKEAGKTISKQDTQLRKAASIVAKRDSIISILKNTAESADNVKALIVQHVKDALGTANRGKALTLVRDAKNSKELTKAFARINRWAEDEIKVGIKADVLKLQKKIMDSPSIAIDYKARVKELMGDFELKGHREDTLKRLKSTQDFLNGEIGKGNDVELPRRILKSLEILNRTPFEDITINQLKGLQAEMELLEDLGRTKFRTTESVWEIQKARILDEVSKQAVEPITKIQLIKPEIGERLTATQKFKNLIWSAANQAARIDKAISPMDTIFDLLDGGRATYDGANFRFFKGQVDAGYGRYISRKDALQSPVIELSTKHRLDDTNFERMGIVAAREQDGGIEKLLASGFTKEAVDAVKLTPQEQEVLDLMRSTFDSQFPEIQDTMRRVYNQPVQKVKNYFSFMTDFKAMDDSEVFARFGSQSPEQFGAPKKNIEAGFTKSRVGGDQKIKVNALDIFLAHTDNTSYLLELGETSKMLGEVAASDKYAELVGDVGQLMVREWIDVVARKGGAAGASQIAVLDTLRRNVGAGILGLKLSTVAIQPTSLIDGMGFIGVKYGTKGFTNFITDSEWRKFVARMPEIKDRLGGEFALRELTDDNWLQEIQRKGFVPLQKLDQMSAGAVAAGAYERKMVELGRGFDLTGPFDEEALAFAQLAVRRTQSSGSFKDVPLAVSRGALTGNRSLDRAILQFQNFLLTRWSRVRHDAIRAGINTKDPKKAIPVFTAIIFSALAASGVRLGVNKVQDFVTGKDDPDSPVEDLTRSFMFEMTGNVPFLGTTVSMAMYDGEMFPILDAPKGVISGINRVITSESDSAKLRGFAEFMGSTGAMLGVPGSAQAEQLARGALQDEKAEPKGKKVKTPPGLPELPSLKSSLPKLPALPSL